MLRKKIKHALKDNVLDQYSRDLIIVTKTKQLFLRPKLSLRELSNEVGIPVDEVKQVLREKLQLTFFEFISSYKVNKAKILLKNTRADRCSISTISAQSGFNTKDSFEAIFKQHTNMTPEEYRVKYLRIEPDSSSSYEN